MPRLNEKKRRELQEDIIANKHSREELAKKYKLSTRTLRKYYAEAGLGRKVGKPKREKEIEIEEPESEPIEKQIARAKREEIELETEPDMATHDLPPLEPMHKAEITPQQKPELDPEKDYCAECYHKRQLATEVDRTMARCPACRVDLRWE